MQIYKVLGHVTLSCCHPSFQGARLLATEPVGCAAVGGPEPADPELVIVWDEIGAGMGSQIAVSDGAEAAHPFHPDLKPVDAYCTAILDEVTYDSRVTEKLKF